MKQSHYSRNRSDDSEFFWEQMSRFSQYLDQLQRQTEEAIRQSLDEQAPARPAEPMTIEAKFEVIGETARPGFQKDLADISRLRRAVYRQRTRLIEAVILAIIGLFLSPPMAATIASLAFLRFYWKVVKAAWASCPNCQKRFGRRLPLTIGGDCCRHCGLSLTAQGNQRRTHGE